MQKSKKPRENQKKTIKPIKPIFQNSCKSKKMQKSKKPRENQKKQ